MAATITHPADEQVANRPAPRDFRQEVTDSIVRMLEEGVAPWQKPWEPGASAVHAPMNPTSGRAYRGGNAIHLIATAMRKGYDDPRWMTYKQAGQEGWQVRRGEKGTQIEFWDIQPGADAPRGRRGDRREDEQQPGSDNSGRDRGRLIHRVYTVFNATQIEGVPPYVTKQRTQFEVVQAGEDILQNSGVRIAHDQNDRAFYNRVEDGIHLPAKEAFKDQAGYYGTALHELAHATGHPSRLNRPTLNESYRFGDLNYAKEELRAELASVFLAAERGIPHEPQQHAAYVGSWIKALREDKNEIFRAAHDASAATDFLLSLERDKSIAEEELINVPLRAPSSASPAAGVDISLEAAELRRDREQVEELDLEPSNSQQPLEKRSKPGGDRETKATVAPVAPAQAENSEVAIRYEPGSATVNAQDKRTGTDGISLISPAVDVNGRQPATPRGDTNIPENSLKAASLLASKLLGDTARTRGADVDSGSYCGPIIGETPDLFLQRLVAGEHSLLS